MNDSDDDELYSDIPELETQEGEEECIYSIADGEDYEAAEEEIEELYDDPNIPPPPLPNLKLTQASYPPPPPLRKDSTISSATSVTKESKSKGNIQISPACLGLNTVRIKNMKDGLKKIGILKEKSKEPMTGQDKAPLQLKKCENLIKKIPPPTSPKNFSKNNDENQIYEDPDLDNVKVEEVYEIEDEMPYKKPDKIFKTTRQAILPPVPPTTINNHVVEPENLMPRRPPPPPCPKNSVKNYDEEEIYEDPDRDTTNDGEQFENPIITEKKHEEPYKATKCAVLPPVQKQIMKPPTAIKNNNFTDPGCHVQIIKIENFDWYWENIDREKSERMLKPDINKDGSFLVRKSKNDNADYAISVTYNGKIYHLIVRRRPDGQYAIGNEKENEMTFPEVWDMVHYYKNSYLELLPNESKNSESGWVNLKYPINKI